MDEKNEVLLNLSLEATPEELEKSPNLNAGINAMRRGDLVTAGKYRPKAGSSPEAEYSRALLMYKKGDTTGALNLLRKLERSENGEVALAAQKTVTGIEETEAANARTYILLE